MNDQATRQAIGDALRAYCRGIDRLDGASVAAAFHPDAELLDYGPEAMKVDAFIERVLPALRRRFAATQHRLSNTTVELAGGTAKVESYVLAFHVERLADGERLHTFNGRYIDRFEERGGLWRIAERMLRHDWSSVTAIEATMGGAWVDSGRDGSPDALDD